MGSDPIALPLLHYLHAFGSDLFELVAVVSQPDRPKGRGRHCRPNAIAEFAQQQGLLTFKPEQPGKAERLWMEAEKVDMGVVMAYGHIINRQLLATPPLGFVNMHASILPQYRGASPIETAVASGETETGVSLMRMELAMDTGPVLDVEKVSIGPVDSGADVRTALADATVPLFKRNIACLLAGNAPFVEQEPQLATYCRKLKKTDGQLDFTVGAKVLANHINGLFPWPGCYCIVGNTQLKLKCARAMDQASVHAPGTVVRADKTGVYLATGKGILKIEQLQRPGGKMLPAQQFLQGFILQPGDVCAGGEMAPLVSPVPF